MRDLSFNIACALEMCKICHVVVFFLYYFISRARNNNIPEDFDSQLYRIIILKNKKIIRRLESHCVLLTLTSDIISRDISTFYR